MSQTTLIRSRRHEGRRTESVGDLEDSRDSHEVEESSPIEMEISRLASEFGEVPADRVADVANEVREHLLENAQVTRFVPVLTYRFARQRLRDERALKSAA